jgi:membrane carboxypeptidase/penicillin-binding protein PbpC
MMLKAAVTLAAILTAAASAYAMRPFPDSVPYSKNVIDRRGEPAPKTTAGPINWRFPAKAPVSASVKYGAADQPWDYRIRTNFLP